MTTEPVTQPEITLDPVAWQAAIDAFAVLQEMVPLTLIRHALLAYINAAPVDPRIAQLEAEKARLVEALTFTAMELDVAADHHDCKPCQKSSDEAYAVLAAIKGDA